MQVREKFYGWTLLFSIFLFQVDLLPFLGSLAKIFSPMIKQGRHSHLILTFRRQSRQA
jgi:hypothetical protein